MVTWNYVAASEHILGESLKDHRSFLKTSSLGGTAATSSTLAGPAYAAGKQVLTMRGFPALDDASTCYSTMIAEMSYGALIVDKKRLGP